MTISDEWDMDRKIEKLLYVYNKYMKNDNEGKLAEFLVKVEKDFQKTKDEYFKKIFVELENKLCKSNVYSYYIVENDKGLFNIFLIINAFYISRENVSNESLIHVLVDDGNFCYVVEDVDKDNAEKFIKALYMYNTFKQRANSSGDAKDLVQNDMIWFKPIQGNKIYDSQEYERVVYYDSEILPYKLEKLDFDSSIYAPTFKEALDTVYKKKYIGTKIHLLNK